MKLTTLLQSFPYEAIPDGSVWYPHHFTYGVLLALLFIGVAWDNRTHNNPWRTALGQVVSLFAFLFVWPHYPVAGASLTLIGLAVSLCALLGGYVTDSKLVDDSWPMYEQKWLTWTVLAFTLVAVDDALSHAFGWWTPLDWLWVTYLASIMQ